MQCLSNKKLLSKYISFPDLGKGGFTLIEIIIVLVMSAIVASMAVSFFGNTFLDSTTPFIMIQEQFSFSSASNVDHGANDDPGLLESIEVIIADYNNAAVLTDEDVKNAFIASVSGNINYDGDLSESDFSSENGLPVDITDTGTTLSFTKVGVRKNDQKIIAFFPVF